MRISNDCDEARRKEAKQLAYSNTDLRKASKLIFKEVSDI
jgi:hypothetical protein